MLSLLTHGWDTFELALAGMGLKSPTQYNLVLEHKVTSPLGRGKASHTDVWLQSDHQAVAIEAKWTEPMYVSAQSWLGKGKNLKNRLAVLEGWITLLQRHTKKSLHPQDLLLCVYQMIHRAASAATVERPVLAYFIFKSPTYMRNDTATAGHVETELRRLWEALGRPETFPFFLVEISAKPTTLFDSFFPRAPDENKADEICAALQGKEPLFDFALCSVKRIGPI